MTTTQAIAAPTTEDILRAQSEGGVEFVDRQLWEKPVSIESSEVAMTVGSLLKAQASEIDDARVFDSSLGYQCRFRPIIRPRFESNFANRADKIIETSGLRNLAGSSGKQ
ncbi:MAG TPA: hypothetical protein VG326_01150 [Tepidisphaeraceae bacterium]|jgi:hypothetical protein|nr:hypothetical protein [Tepidisphaeraceae bacterium]